MRCQGEPCPGAFLGKGRELRLRLVEVVAGEQQAIDMLAVPRPLLDLVEVALVGLERIRRLCGAVSVVAVDRLCQKVGHGVCYSLMTSTSWRVYCCQWKRVRGRLVIGEG